MIRRTVVEVDLAKMLSMMPEREVKDLMRLCKYRLAKAQGFHALNDEEKQMVNQNRNIWAIKSLRSRLGLGLKEAKECVEYYIYNKDV